MTIHNLADYLVRLSQLLKREINQNQKLKCKLFSSFWTNNINCEDEIGSIDSNNLQNNKVETPPK
jgi:hypothetical protein